MGDSYVQTMEENPIASRRITLARKSTIVVVTKMRIKAVRYIFFELSNRIIHQNLFSSPVIYKQAN